MTIRRRVTHRRLKRGRGFFGDLFNGIKNIAQKTGIISKLAPIVGTVVGHPNIGSAVGGIAKSFGYGRKRGRGGIVSNKNISALIAKAHGHGKRKRGRGIFDVLGGILGGLGRKRRVHRIHRRRRHGGRRRRTVRKYHHKRHGGHLGYGRRRKHHYKRRGRGIADVLSKVHDYVKDNHLISRAASTFGYGKRRTKTRMHHRGRGIAIF